MLPKPLRLLWGDLSIEDFKRFGLLALALMLTVGPYWMLRSIREAIFIDLVGASYQPYGKLFSFLFIIPLVLIYSKLIDLVRRQKLFFVIYLSYAVTFSVIAFFIEFPQFVTLPTSSPFAFLFTWIPGKTFGWIIYAIFESFGALTPALFWSFVASTTNTDAAKRGYGMIISIAQIGTITGSLVVELFSQKIGLPLLIIAVAASITPVPLLIRYFNKINHTQPIPLPPPAQKTGFLEGLRLLIANPYVLGIFIITTGYEIVGSVFEYQMTLLGAQAYPTKEAFAAFFASYGRYANILTLLFSLVGTSFFLRTFGLRVCLLLFPLATGAIIVTTRIFPVLSVLFVAMILLKGLSYSLNNPAKEILYIPTSKDIKFKAKGWIDAFGSRFVKISGSSMNIFCNALSPLDSIIFATPMLLSIVSIWAIAARLVSKKHHQLVEENKIIG